MKIAPAASRVLVLLALGAAVASCASRGPRVYRFVPLPAPTYSILGEAATIRTSALRLTVVPLDDAGRRAFIRERGSEATSDPFGPERSGAPRYFTFRLQVENLGSSEPLTFQPQGIILAAESGDRIYPLDYPEAYRRFAGGSSSDPRLLDDLAKYMFDVGVTIGPGETIDRLLIYPAPRKVASRLRMEFNFLQALSSSTSYDVLFAKEPLP